MENITKEINNINNSEEIPIENFVIEYPLNYNEIVERKLKILEREYEDTQKCNFKQEDLKNDYSDTDSDNENSNNKEGENKINEEIIDKNEIHQNSDNQYYQCLNDLDDEDFQQVEEDCKNDENNMIVSLEKSENIVIKNSENDLDGIEFINDEVIPKQFVPKQPLQNPEKIKNIMKTISMKPPLWAKK